MEECRKPQGERYAFVQFVDAAGAARARQALHDAWVSAWGVSALAYHQQAVYFGGI